MAAIGAGLFMLSAWKRKDLSGIQEPKSLRSRVGRICC